MPNRYACLLEDRGVLSIAGPDARTFLQGLVSNDMNQVSTTRAQWAALLTPQGKYLFDFFVVDHNGALVLDGEDARLTDLIRKLSMYRLRADVTITDRRADLAVAAVWGSDALSTLGLSERGIAAPWNDGVAFADPRTESIGARVVSPRHALSEHLQAEGFEMADRSGWEHGRIALGLPDGSRDLAIEKAILLENGFDDWGGIAWDKGCWMGQELTARTRYRGLVKKRLTIVDADRPLPASGTAIMMGEKEVGTLRSGVDGIALALVRLDALAAVERGEAVLTAADVAILPRLPRRALTMDETALPPTVSVR